MEVEHEQPDADDDEDQPAQVERQAVGADEGQHDGDGAERA